MELPQIRHIKLHWVHVTMGGKRSLWTLVVISNDFIRRWKSNCHGIVGTIGANTFDCQWKNFQIFVQYEQNWNYNGWKEHFLSIPFLCHKLVLMFKPVLQPFQQLFYIWVLAKFVLFKLDCQHVLIGQTIHLNKLGAYQYYLWQA